MGDEILTIGQVQFYKDDVAKFETGKAKNGKTLYSVFLKNGTKIRFYDQDPKMKPSVDVGYDLGNENKYGTAFKGIMGMTVEGSKEDDYYHVMDCDYYKFNLQGGGKDHVRVVNLYGEQYSADYNLDEGADSTAVIDGSKGMSMSEGFFVRKNPNGEEVSTQTTVQQTPTQQPVPPATQQPAQQPAQQPSAEELNVPKTVKDNLKGLIPGEVLITKQNNELREYHDANGNTVIRYDGMNDDPEEYFGEEEVISPDGKIISYTQRFSLGSEDGVKHGNVLFERYEYDENEELVRVVSAVYEGGILKETEVTNAEDLEEQLIGTVMPGIVIEDQEKLDFLNRKGVHILGRH